MWRDAPRPVEGDDHARQRRKRGRTRVRRVTALVCVRNQRRPLRAFGWELDALRLRTFAAIGEADVAYVRRLNRFSRAMEIVGRVLIHFSPEPITLLRRRRLALGAQAAPGDRDRPHRAARRLRRPARRRGASPRRRSAGTRRSTRSRGATGTTSATTATRTSPARTRTSTSARAPDGPDGVKRRDRGGRCRSRSPSIFPNFGFVHERPLHRPERRLHRQRSPATSSMSCPTARRRACAARGRSRCASTCRTTSTSTSSSRRSPGRSSGRCCSATGSRRRCATSTRRRRFCGHVGDDVESYPEGTKARTRAEWYAMQVEARTTTRCTLPISILCGGLDRQIEHHLFPTLPRRALARDRARGAGDLREARRPLQDGHLGTHAAEGAPPHRAAVELRERAGEPWCVSA